MYVLQHCDLFSNNDINTPELHCYVGSKQHHDVGICMSVKSDRMKDVFSYLWDLENTI